jgi:hypothetical protein
MATARLHPSSLAAKNKLSEALAMIATPCRGAMPTRFSNERFRRLILVRHGYPAKYKSIDRPPGTSIIGVSNFSPLGRAGRMGAASCDEPVVDSDGRKLGPRIATARMAACQTPAR